MGGIESTGHFYFCSFTNTKTKNCFPCQIFSSHQEAGVSQDVCIVACYNAVNPIQWLPYYIQHYWLVNANPTVCEEMPIVVAD